MFLKFFLCWLSKNAKPISRHNSHMDLFILIASSITSDSERGDDFFLEVTTSSDNITRSSTLSAIASWQHLLNYDRKLV